MASITLQAVFLHDAVNLDNYLALENCIVVTEESSGPADVELYASGRTRRSSMRGTVTAVALQFEGCTRAEVDQLRDWQDTLLLLRDPRGRVHYGSYDGKAVTVDEYVPVDRADVTIRFSVVTSYDPVPVSGSGES